MAYKGKPLIIGLGVLILIGLAFLLLPRPQPTWSDESPYEREGKAMMTGVRDVHVFVICSAVGPNSNVPEILSPENFAPIVVQEIKDKYYPQISFSYGIKREPVVTRLCGDINETPGLNTLEDGGNLNFIMNIFLVSQKIAGQMHQMALISKFIYRSKSPETLPRFLWQASHHDVNLIDLSDPDEAKKELAAAAGNGWQSVHSKGF